MNLKEIAYSHYLPAKRKRRRANTCEGYASELRRILWLSRSIR